MIMELLANIYKCTIPLSCMDKEGRKAHIGSGILIKTECNFYLLSARHVFENEKDVLNKKTVNNIVYCKDDIAYPINGVFAYYSADEKIDILVCKLSESTQGMLYQFFEFMPSYMMAQESILRYTKDYYIVGYPIGKVKRSYPYDNTIKRSLYTIQTAGLKSDEFNFHVEYHRDKMTNLQTGLKISTPHVKGMSGCGLWYKCQENIYLVGIVHYFNNKESIISATKIDYAIEILNRKFNDSYE